MVSESITRRYGCCSLSLSLALTDALAGPVVSSCTNGDAPSTHTTSPCSIRGSAPPCVYAGGTLTCDLDQGVCDAGGAIVTVNYRDDDIITSFGSCHVDAVEYRFYCVVDDPAGEITSVYAFGTDYADEKVDFTWLEGATRWNLFPTGTQKMAAWAHGRKGNDVMKGSWFTGTKYSEALYGEDGIDSLHGNPGNDEIRGGAGSDTINGGPGDDRLFGDGGVDYLYGDDGKDTIYGGDEGDFIEGGEHDDKLFGANGNDTIHGDGGNDMIAGGNHDDILHGDAGIDQLFGSSGIDTLHGGADGDWLHGSWGNDTLNGDGGDDVLYGGADEDLLYGGADDDVLCETFQPVNDCAAYNLFNGGSGSDVAYLSGLWEGGGPWCPSMQQQGNYSVESASHSNRDWSQVMLPPNTAGSFSQPAECTEIIELGGQ